MPSQDAATIVPPGFGTVLVLAGGNALGAYHMGACERLAEAGVEPPWIVGCSVGAVTAAILLGNPPERRFHALRTFWRQVAQPAASGLRAFPAELRARLSNDFGLMALLAGRPGMFRARWPGLWSILPLVPPDLGLRDHRPLGRTLERLIDFERLNSGEARLSIAALDIETGEEVWFDSRETRIGPEHLLASTALMPLFAPIRIGTRLLCDAGLANNLPLDRVLRADLPGPTLCIASDLLRPEGAAPRSLDEALSRVQDLAFGLQTRRSLVALQRERELRRQLQPDLPPVILGLLADEGAPFERSLKALDFSTAVIEERAARGRRDMSALLARLAGAPRDAALALVEG